MPSVYGRAQGGNLTVDWTAYVSRRRFLRGAGLLGSGVALATAFGCRSGGERPLTTLDRTISLGMDGVLRPGPGEQHEVRTELAQAQCATIRLKLLKIGARIRVSVRKVWFSLAEGYPYQALFSQVYANLIRLCPTPLRC